MFDTLAISIIGIGTGWVLGFAHKGLLDELFTRKNYKKHKDYYDSFDGRP